MTSPYKTQTIHGRHWVWFNEEVIGAVSYNAVRAYVFPFFTPAGTQVLQECAPDHLHHQGIMVGQDEVNGENFWAMLHPGYPSNYQALVEESCTVGDSGVTFDLTLDWTTKDNAPIVRERRLIRLARHNECNEAWVRSTLMAGHGAVAFGVTKEGGVGMRVHPLLETPLGGHIRDSEGRVGEGQVFDQQAAWIEVSGRIGSHTAGVLMAPDSSEPRLPWFVRDYGLHLHSPRRHSSLKLAADESVTSTVCFLAHDGIAPVEKLSRMLQVVSETHE